MSVYKTFIETAFNCVNNTRLPLSYLKQYLLLVRGTNKPRLMRHFWPQLVSLSLLFLRIFLTVNCGLLFAFPSPLALWPQATPLVSMPRFPRTSCRHRVSLMTRDNGRLRNFGPPPPFAYCTAADIKLPSQDDRNTKPLDGAFESQLADGHCSLSVRSSNFRRGSGSWSLKRRRCCLFQSRGRSFQFDLVKYN